MRKLKSFIHHFFVPHRGNNYRAKALHHNFLTFYLVVAVSFSIVFRMLPTDGNVLGYATDITPSKLLELTNKERAKNNLQPLKMNDKLTVAADSKAKDMFALNYWNHYSPTGATPWNFILGAGYEYEFAGENLAKNFMFSDGVVQAWMNSPSHRENLLRPEYTDVGFAVENGTLNGEETTLVVQMFGKPLATAADASDDNGDTKGSNVQVVPEKAEVKNLPAVENKQAPETGNAKSFAWINLYRDGTLLFFVFLAIALAVDFYVASKLNIVRLTGKNIIHIMFLGFIIVAVWMIAKGAII